MTHETIFIVLTGIIAVMALGLLLQRGQIEALQDQCEALTEVNRDIIKDYFKIMRTHGGGE